MRMLLKVSCLLDGGEVPLLPACFEDDERGVMWWITPVKYWK